MIARVLPKGEYERLKETELEKVYPILPEGANVVVVEEDGKLLRTWALIPMLHAEGLWASPETRGRAGATRLLLKKAYEVGREMGTNVLLTSSLEEKVDRLIHKVGGIELPGRHFVINIQEPS